MNFPNNWIYNPESVRSLIRRIAGVNPVAADLEFQWLRGGGKALGLRLCELLFSNTKLTIPQWFAVTPKSHNDQILDTENLTYGWLEFGAMVRSSTWDEDWVDSRSGVHRSTYAARMYLRKHMDEQIAACGSIVVQSKEWGCGLVIDIAWSELLQRDVIRIATGTSSMEGGRKMYTSATWDQEAPVGVFDAETGEILCPYTYMDIDDVVQAMVHTVVPRLKQLGITFAVQFEMILDVDSRRLSVVQIRPSPHLLSFKKDGMPTETLGELLATTGKVNGVGVISAEALLVITDHQGASIADRILPLDRQFHDLGELEMILDEDEIPEAKGRIVCWDPQALYRYGGSIWQAYGAWRTGAVAQLSERAIIINSAHGTSIDLSDPRGSNKKIEAFTQAKTGGLLVAIQHEQMRTLRSAIRNDSLRLTIMSDGIVAQIYMIKHP